MPACIRQAGEFDLFSLHQRASQQFPFLLESRVQAAKIGRYSLLLGGLSKQAQATDAKQLADLLKLVDSTPHSPQLAPELPFSGGWFLYLAYEAAQIWQRGFSSTPRETKPVARAAYCEKAIIVDHTQQLSWFVSLDGHAEDLKEHCSQTISTAPTSASAELPSASPVFRADQADQYKASVAKAIEYILAGDIYQANLSRTWLAPLMPAEDFMRQYAQLRRVNPASFAASCIWPDFAIASASPERLFRVADGQIDTRPIAGTRPRGESTEVDAAMRKELQANRKELAEHIMLVDLERNDLGRIAKAGSVEVDELLSIETYASVHHLVSNVKAQLRSEVRPSEMLKSVFPGGTITGCPKLRCMQIIAELEQRPRGAYTGSLGYISRCGRMDFNILIRTLVWTPEQVRLDAGAGIVADSMPEKELAETEAKAAGVLHALGSVC